MFNRVYDLCACCVTNIWNKTKRLNLRSENALCRSDKVQLDLDTTVYAVDLKSTREDENKAAR